MGTGLKAKAFLSTALLLLNMDINVISMHVCVRGWVGVHVCVCFLQ